MSDAATLVSSKRNGVSNDFWRFTIGNVATVLVTVSTIVYGAGKVNTQLEAMREWQRDTGSKILEMDKNGTQAGKQRDALEDQMISSHETRLSRVEESVAKVSVIIEKLNSIQSEISEIKQQHPEK